MSGASGARSGVGAGVGETARDQLDQLGDGGGGQGVVAVDGEGRRVVGGEGDDGEAREALIAADHVDQLVTVHVIEGGVDDEQVVRRALGGAVESTEAAEGEPRGVARGACLLEGVAQPVAARREGVDDEDAGAAQGRGPLGREEVAQRVAGALRGLDVASLVRREARGVTQRLDEA